MKLNLSRALAVIDIETTGINVSADRIVQIAVLKLLPDGSHESFEALVNPGIPISKEASAIHGITDLDVKDKPDFRSLAPQLIRFINNCDIAGYNSTNFDIPLMMEEFLRNDVDFNITDRKLIDVQNIFHKMEKRTLKAAYKFYTGKLLENAHDAMADVKATYDVLLAQIEKYEGKEYDSENHPAITPVKNDVEALSGFSRTRKFADFAGRIAFSGKGVEVFNFGKHKGKPVEEVFRKEPSYYTWMMDGDFPLYTKKVITEIRTRIAQP